MEARQGATGRPALFARATGRTIYVLDEPSVGLHAADVHKLIEVLDRLVDAGNSGDERRGHRVVVAPFDTEQGAQWITERAVGARRAVGLGAHLEATDAVHVLAQFGDEARLAEPGRAGDRDNVVLAHQRVEGLQGAVGEQAAGRWIAAHDPGRDAARCGV